MYLIKNYLTNETVAVVTRREDAIAMTQASRNPFDPVLIYEKKSPEPVDKS